MSGTTPKERYDARMKLKRDAEKEGWKADEILTSEYAFDLAERFVSALEGIEMNLRANNQKD